MLPKNYPSVLPPSIGMTQTRPTQDGYSNHKKFQPSKKFEWLVSSYIWNMEDYKQLKKMTPGVTYPALPRVYSIQRSTRVSEKSRSRQFLASLEKYQSRQP